MLVFIVLQIQYTIKKCPNLLRVDKILIVKIQVYKLECDFFPVSQFKYFLVVVKHNKNSFEI